MCAAPVLAATTAPARNAPERFEINAFDVSGVTKLDAATVEAAVYPFAGPDRTAADVEAARRALEAAYKARGFESVLVEIPPQPGATFVAGIVELKVSEASIGRLRVVGSKYHALTIVTAQVPALKEGEVPDLRAAQAQLAAANNFPDREITPSIKAGAVPGTIDVDLRVEDTLPLHAGVTLNNDHATGTTALRLGGNVSYTNLWQRGQTLAVAFQGSPQDFGESQVISGSYTIPLLGTPWTILAFAYKSNSNVAAIGGTQVLGNGYDIAGRLSYRLPGDRLQQSVSFGLDYKDFLEDISVPSGDPAIPPAVFTTPIAYVPATASYTVQKATEASALGITISTTMGIRQLASDEAAIKTKRLDAVGNFVRLNFDADFSYSFGGDYALVARAAGQIADSPLVANEQFSIGGATSVRGYFLAEAVGDNGLNGSVELRSPSFATKIGNFVDELRLFAFVDGGLAGVLSPLPDQIDQFSLLSVGIGGRFSLFRTLSGSAAYGLALTRGTVTAPGDGQFVFTLGAAF
ncbi:MAG: ShlB/FhaC/HecB family hemolysin secretion/activation protein [Polymorphobacter sp.]